LANPGAEQYDVIVIGSGQGGVPLARTFAKAGKRTALVERAELGGTCINYGCTPTKTMVGVADVAHLVRRAGEYGVEATFDAVDMQKVRELKRAIVEDFRGSMEKALAKTENLEVIRGHAAFSNPRELEIRLTHGGMRTIGAVTICINTGTRSQIPDIEGLCEVSYLTNESIMELDHLPKTMAILGGGYIGLEFGQMFSRFGSQVTILDHAPRFLPHEDRDVSEEVHKILEEEGLKIHSGVETHRVSKQGDHILLEYSDGTGKHALTAEALLVAVGRTPNSDDLGLEAAGIEKDEHGFIKADARLRTNVEGIYVLGDVKGGPAFTHISYDDFRILKANLLEGRERTTEGRPIPYTMYIDPQLGRIGLTEEQATKQGLDFRVAKMAMTHVARALEVNETRGFVKALIDNQTGKILGAAVLGLEGGEVMSMIQLAMAGGLTAKDLNETIFAHPTLAELLNNLFRD